MSSSVPSPTRLFGQPTNPKDGVRVSRTLARTPAAPTVMKARGIRLCLLAAESKFGRIEEVEAGPYEMPKSWFREMLGCRDDKHLAAELEGIADIKIDWGKYVPGAGGSSRIVSIRWDYSQPGLVEFAIDPLFLKDWKDNSRGFRSVRWEILVSFKSVFAAKLYEYCAFSHIRRKDPAEMPWTTTARLNRAELRELFGIPEGAYEGTNAGRFLQEVRKAVKTVNESAPGFRVEFVVQGRGTSAVHFFKVFDGPLQERLEVASPPIRRARSQAERFTELWASLPATRQKSLLRDARKRDRWKEPHPDTAWGDNNRPAEEHEILHDSAFWNLILILTREENSKELPTALEAK